MLTPEEKAELDRLRTQANILNLQAENAALANQLAFLKLQPLEARIAELHQIEEQRKQAHAGKKKAKSK